MHSVPGAAQPSSAGRRSLQSGWGAPHTHRMHSLTPTHLDRRGGGEPPGGGGGHAGHAVCRGWEAGRQGGLSQQKRRHGWQQQAWGMGTCTVGWRLCAGELWKGGAAAAGDTWHCGLGRAVMAGGRAGHAAQQYGPASRLSLSGLPTSSGTLAAGSSSPHSGIEASTPSSAAPPSTPLPSAPLPSAPLALLGMGGWRFEVERSAGMGTAGCRG